MTGAPFWSDDFDMDLPRVIPEALGIVGDIADLTLYTVGTPDARLGNLNHPAVWNGYDAMLAYFGTQPYEASFIPPGCVHPGDVLITCTVWEAIRDAWAHAYAMHVDGLRAWDTFALRKEFDRLLWFVRGWCEPDEEERARHIGSVRRSLRDGVPRMRRLLGA